MANGLFIRDQDNGLNWFEGVPLKFIEPRTWVWSTTRARGNVVFITVRPLPD
jgi:hypothetical protein